MKGITLIELIVVIAILAIILGISIPNFNKWRKRISVEGDVKKIYSFIQLKRKEAFVKRQSYVIEASGKQVCSKIGNVIDKCIELANNFSGQMEITSKGVIKNTSQNRTISLDDDIDSDYDCVKGHLVRVKMGKMENGECKVK
ncbi:hypothetical protein HG1285_09956 [Hydrogenivirga sp. 128-5-R1-1]|nr:hypothetical protein HG1285_09956 [Hydrogenivirga sp. 128-5-R1-1]